MGAPILSSRRRRRALVGGRVSYASRVKNLFGSNLIGYWQMNEATGAVAVDSSPEGNNGSYTGVTLANAAGPAKVGGAYPYFDGANDYNNVYSVALNADFDNSIGTVAALCKVSGSGAWTDATLRTIMQFRADVNNRLSIYKNSGNNSLLYRYEAGGTDELITDGSHSETDWFLIGMTWNASGNMTAYFNGSSVGTPQAIDGTWAGALQAQGAIIGATTTVGPAEVWDGYIGHALITKHEATSTEMLKLAQWAGVA